MSETPRPICDYEGSDYQSAFWDAGGRTYEDRAEVIALNRLLPPGKGKLLELGAGAGRNSARYQGYDQVVLVDYSRSQLRLAQETLGAGGRYIFVAADVYRLPFASGVFQASTMVRVIHHLVDPQAAIAQIRQTLAPSALFILEYANKQNAKAILRWAMRRQDWSPFEPDPVELVELNYNFHPAHIRALLNQNEFMVQRQLTVSHFRMNLLKRIVPTGLLVQLDSLAQLSGNWWQLSPSVFVGARAVGKHPPANERGFWRCPVCASPELIPSSAPESLHCHGCGRRWSAKDGIYDFREPFQN